MARIGVVVIGRNEGERLIRCLRTLNPAALPIVYVDSGSTDGSPVAARALGVEVVSLDLSIVFTAARARNSGTERLLQLAPEIEYVQFVDGDCEVASDWLEKAAKFLDEHPKAAVACGRRRERHPERSVYNRLCDIEWETPIGEAAACGGDALMRVTAFQQVAGFNSTLIAGEEPELCVRLRRAGWTINRLDAEMTLHDAAMTRFGQWWKRAVRCGFAYSLGAHLHGAPPERHYIRERRRFMIWGFLVPVLILATAWPSDGWSLFGFAIYPLQVARIARKIRGRSTGDSIAFGISCMASKVPEFIGWCRFQVSCLRRGPARIIEYK
ncbi:MAG: glycosyltransferase [Planctomycetes bacterium]|nr:glycosyltransferase [Planctomycetota bacterium]